MKRILILLSSALLTCSLFGCSGGSSSKRESSSELLSAVPTNPVNESTIPEEAIQPFLDYFEGFNSNNAALVASSITPKVYIDAMKNDDSYKELEEMCQSNIDLTAENWKELYGDNAKGTFDGEISNTKLTPEQLHLAELCIKYTYYNVKVDFDIEDGYEITYNYSITGDTNSTVGEETACFVKIKDDGWHMLALNAIELNQYNGASDPYEEK